MRTTRDRWSDMARLSRRSCIGGGIVVMAALVIAQPSSANPSASMSAWDARATPCDDSTLGDCIVGSWIHSWEEDTDEVTVYRPEDYPFPPSRGREGYEFLSGGSLIYHGIGPADGPTSEPGRWEETAPNQVAITIEQRDGPDAMRKLRVVSCSADRLEVAT
jgi:hypothetical protein